MNFQEIVKSRIRKQIQNSNLCLKKIYIHILSLRRRMIIKQFSDHSYISKACLDGMMGLFLGMDELKSS